MAKNDTVKYKFLEEDTGYCRAYYRNLKGRLFCIQNESPNHLLLVWYECTSDGEPLDPMELPPREEFDEVISGYWPPEEDNNSA
jgi:hypothetical protein